MTYRSCVIIFFVLLAACGGGSGRTSVPDVPISLDLNTVRGSLSEAESDLAAKPQPTYTPGVNDLLYVGNAGNDSITVYRHDAHDNAAPLYVISGPKTRLNGPGQLSEDAAGNLYVANNITAQAASVLVFAHGAKGNVAPIRVLGGAKTQIDGILGMTVDKSTGKLFIESIGAPVFEWYGYYDTILRFAPNSTGNVPPFASGSFANSAGPSVAQLDSDSTGKNLIAWAATPYGDIVACCDSLLAVAKQFPNNTAPLEPYQFDVISSNGSEPGPGIADDPTTKSYLVSGNYSTCTGSTKHPVISNVAGIIRFAENVSGYGFDSGAICEDNLKPVISAITSDTCAGQLAIGYLRNIYAVHSRLARYGPNCPKDAIYVYMHDSSGNVPPLRVLSGPATKLDEPFGIYEGQ